jgi:aldehyde dehydrogenase (NAD+)
MHVDRVRRLLSDHGGSVVQGGGVDLATRMVEPTIVLDPVPSSALPAEEIFAPILPVVSVPSAEEAIASVPARPAPLAIYLFTGSRALRERVLAETRSGSVVVNDVAFQLGNPHLPFGGVGESGWGVYHGRWGFDTLTSRAPSLSRTARPDLKSGTRPAPTPPSA